MRVSYVKVAEYQRRGALHFHCVLRLDRGAAGDDRERVEPPAAEFARELLIEAVRAAVAHVSVHSPAPEHDDARSAARARSGGGGRSRSASSTLARRRARRRRAPAYIAKYATKSTEVVGGLMHRLGAGDLEPAAGARRTCAATSSARGSSAREPHLHDLRLRRWAHTLGFRGHCFTKSRRYSTTFTALRRARHEHVLERLHGGERRDPWGGR